MQLGPLLVPVPLVVLVLLGLVLRRRLDRLQQCLLFFMKQVARRRGQ